MKYDHILLIGHGGPRQPEEVMPFLQAMIAGKNVSDKRVELIAGHYKLIGGASPYHGQVLRFAADLEKALRADGIDLPVFAGMKHWHPFVKDALADIQAKGLKRGLAIPLTAFRAAALGARYQENLESVKSSLGISGIGHDFLDGWHAQKLFIEAQTDEISRVLAQINVGERQGTPFLFSFHSLPVKWDRVDTQCCYSDEAREASSRVAERLRHSKFLIAFQSRPAESEGEWLGPDIGDVVRELVARSEKQMIVVPLGFFCDHVEILYDLDHKLRKTAEESGIKYLRAQTVIHHPKILSLFEELIRKASLLRRTSHASQ